MTNQQNNRYKESHERNTNTNDPFNIYEYTITGTSLQITVTDPDLINGIIALQDSAIKAVLGDVAATASFGAVSKLGIASGVAFDVLEGIIGQQSFTQIAVSTGMDAAPSYAGASAAGGLADRADGNSVMFANLGSTNRTFDAADIANIQSLYGSASNRSTPPGGWISTHAAGTTPANPAHGERLFH